MNKYKIIAATIVAAVFMSVVPAHALSESGDTNVAYTNENNIPDPDNPYDPHWVVAIPSSITFTDENKRADASLELKPMRGYDLPNGGTIIVTVESTNGYALHAAGADKDSMEYTLSYEGKGMSSTEKEIGDLVATNKIAGTAVLDASATAKVRGAHTDILRYYIETTGVTYP